MVRLQAGTGRWDYVRDGIAFPIPVLTDAEVCRYREACDELEQRLGGKPRTIEVRQMHLHFPWAWELATHPRVLDALEDILGPDLLVWATELFAKHPDDPSVSIGWHRDQPYLGFDSPRAATAWIALSESAPANGCMQAVPRSLEDATALPVERGTPPLNKNKGGERDQPCGPEVIDVVLRPGEMSVHDPQLLHGSGPNRSQRKRVGFAVRFVAPEVRPLRGRPPAILARGRDDHGHFLIVDPPGEERAEQALEQMRKSAAVHFEAMLQNLRT